DVFVADLTADFGENRNRVRIPLAQHLARLHLFVLLHQERSTGRHFVFFQFATLGVEQRDFAVASQNDVFAFVVLHHTHAGELGETTLLRLDVAFFDAGIGRTTDVERTHG